jgi:hypothetical protein
MNLESPPPKVIWICILGSDCDCAARDGEVDQFCANSRKREVEAYEDAE